MSPFRRAAAPVLALAALLAFAALLPGNGCIRYVDPFEPQADASEGLTDVSSDLAAVLEEGRLRGACQAYDAAVESGAATRRQKLLCGKEMYFYEGFGTIGVPKVLVDVLIQRFPEVGPGFSQLGLVQDPTSPERYPLGLGPGRDLVPGVASLAFTCASCHFAVLPDGRYSAGAPNHDFDYGKMNVAIASFPLAAVFGPAGHDPGAMAWIQPMLQRLNSDPAAAAALTQAFVALFPAINVVPPVTQAVEAAWMSWLPGTQDFVMSPVPIDDGVHVISKISSLWGLAQADDVGRYEMVHAQLGWTGVARSLEDFLEAFVRLGQGDTAAWTLARLSPLAEYVHSLRAPENPIPPDPQQAYTGAQLFVTKGCFACHAGARGAGQTLHGYEEIGTDAAMRRWLDPDGDGQPCCGAVLGPGESLTQRIKAPRLVGIWAQQRFLHNGSVTLDELFCRGTARPAITAEPYGAQGHDWTCSGLSGAEKDALLAYLLSH